jgi:hypothetical protein
MREWYCSFYYDATMDDDDGDDGVEYSGWWSMTTETE